MKSEFLVAITQLAAERNLPREVVLNAVEEALISAFKKDHLAERDLAVRISPTTGDVHVFARRTVVAGDAVEDPKNQLTLPEAQMLRAEAQVGTVFEEEVTPANAGRIAAQTAKQVVMQRLRDAERELVFAEYAGREGEIVPAVVQRFEGRNIILELGRAEAIMPPQEQVPIERYRPGARLKVLLVEVGKSPKGPQIVASRAHKDLLRRLFALEVPEIHNGIVAIEAIAREPGARSKVAVRALQDRVDPVGSCVGLRGVRIQNIVNELHGEKIDVLEWSPDPSLLIARALAPAQVMHVIILQPKEGAPGAPAPTAIVVVPDRQLALAIGREGQNARLAAKLTGWRIDIKSTAEAEALHLEPTPVPAAAFAQPHPLPGRPAPRLAGAPMPAQPPAPLPPPEPMPAEALEPRQAGAPAEEAPTLAEALASTETWQVPAGAAPAPPAQRPAIRFAEEIMGRPSGGGGPSRREKEKERDREEAGRAGGRARPAGSRARPAGGTRRKERPADLQDLAVEAEE